jgi:hypothetical protein
MRAGTPVRWQRRQRGLQHRDVVGRGVAARVTRPQQPGQRLAPGDLRPIQKRQQRVMPEGLLPGRRRVLLGIGMVDDQRGVDVDVQPLIRGGGGTGGPRRRPGSRTRSAHPRQVGGINALINQPPHRGRRRRRAKDMLAVGAALPDPVDTVRAVGHRRGQIGEHRTRGIHPRTLVCVGQRGRDLRRQPGAIGQFAQHAHPGMRHHALAVSRHFHPRRRHDILHLRSAFPPAVRNLRQVPSCLAGQALSLIYTPPPPPPREKSRLVPR